ncbi:uncharacterized protein LOC135135071 [Zophobas morio]|uniref:uncharacterized protein LOC135135071 n=1 Tax=Zophobas morio TaxID=2755281 RepID=UPI003082D5E1
MNIINNPLSAKNVRIHGMSSDKWTTKDKVTQYKGLVTLYKRDRQITEVDRAVASKRQLKGLQSLRKDIESSRLKLHNAVGGDRQKLRNILSDNHELQLAYQNSELEKVTEDIMQRNFNKRKALDKINYQMSLKSQQLINLKLEEALLQDRTKYESLHNIKEEHIAKLITGKVQDAILKKQAALEIRQTYTQIIDLMKKDGLYFDGILSAIQEDFWYQCRCILNATKQGQLATEYKNDREQEYQDLEKAILLDMKTRKRDLEIIHQQTKMLQSNLKHLLRRDSDLTTCIVKVEESSDFHTLRKDLQQIESTLHFLQNTTLVSSFEQIYPTLEEQRKQKRRLTASVARCQRNTEIIMTKLAHAELMYSTLRNSMVDTTREYKKRKAELKEAINEEVKKQEWYGLSRRRKCELLANVRLYLKQIDQLCKPIHLPKDIEKKQEVVIAESEVSVPEAEETDGHKIFVELVKKLMFLMNTADEFMDDLKTHAAFKSYEALMSCRAIEPEVDALADTARRSIVSEGPTHTLLSRDDIKTKSVEVVAMHSRNEDLIPMFAGRKKKKWK